MAVLALALAGGLMLVFFLLGLYVAVALGLIAFTLMFFLSDRPVWESVAQIAWNVNVNVVLVAIPLFVLMGELLLRSGLSERLYQTMSKWVGRLPGGLLHSNIAACAVFAAVSGSSVATAATISSVALPHFRAKNYNERMVIGSLAAGGTLGILIPPSINMIVYALLADESIGRLYMGGVFPGLLLTLSFMGVIAVIAKIWPRVAPVEPPVPWRERLLGLVSMLPIVGLIFLVLGTIYFGVATATEAASFGVAGAFLLALVNRRVSWSMLRETLLSTVMTTSMIMLILSAAFIINFILAHLGAPAALARAVSDAGFTPLQMVLVLIGFYILLGTFMDGFSMMVITIPILVPILQDLGINKVWFGILVVMLTEAALISPPEGLNLYVLHGLRKRAIGMRKGTIVDVWIGVLPFLVAIILTLALVVLFPDIVLWLPNTMKGR
ncbi:MAG: TRAP transporter large permease subunit [Dehalococcoidia bacterium]|nr:TRAP transporter large permease subunit [Dehalococcoidia bacterium]MDW8120273.1 TRAP transporter large permease subunit [Chloroflexota bacterium]